MKLYYYLPTQWALENLKHRRLKISRLDELNDPFELVAANRASKSQREIWNSWRKAQIEKWGLICFSKTWKNPVMWSHYSDKHKGICLGFEVSKDLVLNVTYTKNRLNMDLEKLKDQGKLNQNHMLKVFKTKYIDWQYEREARVYAKLENADPTSGYYFHAFDDQIKLTDIFAGPLCTTTKKVIVSSLQTEDKAVKITKTRLAFKTFGIVEQQQGFR